MGEMTQGMIAGLGIAERDREARMRDRLERDKMEQSERDRELRRDLADRDYDLKSRELDINEQAKSDLSEQNWARIDNDREKADQGYELASRRQDLEDRKQDSLDRENRFLRGLRQDVQNLRWAQQDLSERETAMKEQKEQWDIALKEQQTKMSDMKLRAAEQALRDEEDKREHAQNEGYVDDAGVAEFLLKRSNNFARNASNGFRGETMLQINDENNPLWMKVIREHYPSYANVASIDFVIDKNGDPIIEKTMADGSKVRSLPDMILKGAQINGSLGLWNQSSRFDYYNDPEGSINRRWTANQKERDRQLRLEMEKERGRVIEARARMNGGSGASALNAAAGGDNSGGEKVGAGGDFDDDDDDDRGGAVPSKSKNANITDTEKRILRARDRKRVQRQIDDEDRRFKEYAIKLFDGKEPPTNVTADAIYGDWDDPHAKNVVYELPDGRIVRMSPRVRDFFKYTYDWKFTHNKPKN